MGGTDTSILDTMNNYTQRAENEGVNVDSLAFAKQDINNKFGTEETNFGNLNLSYKNNHQPTSASDGALWKDGVIGRVNNYKGVNMDNYANTLSHANKTFGS